MRREKESWMRKIKKSRNMTTNRTNRSRTNGSPSLRGISSYLVRRKRAVRNSKRKIRFNVKLFKFLQMIMTNSWVQETALDSWCDSCLRSRLQSTTFRLQFSRPPARQHSADSAISYWETINGARRSRSGWWIGVTLNLFFHKTFMHQKFEIFRGRSNDQETELSWQKKNLPN